MTSYSIAAKDGLILASLTLAVNIILALTDKFIATSVILSFIPSILVLIKTFGSYYILKRLAIKRTGGRDKKTVWRYCIRTALFSSIICAAYMAFDLTILNPEKPEMLVQETAKLYESMSIMDNNTRSALSSLADTLPLLATISQFIWCLIFGSIFSSIVASVTTRHNNSPFAGIE